MTAARLIDVDFRKYPDRLHWQFRTRYLDEDEHGVWLGGTPGWEARRGTEPPVPFGHAFVKVVPRERWWTALWNATGGIAVYVDIITPPRWDGDRVTMVDLDLDVIQSRDGSLRIDDEDEFEEHQITLGYPPRLVAGARATTAEVYLALESGAEPYGSAGPARLAQWINELG